MVLQILTFAVVSGRGVGPARQDDEAAVIPGDDERLGAHVLAGTRDAIGEQRKRVGGVEVRDSDGLIPIALECDREWRLGRSDRCGVPGEGGVDVGPKAVDVDVELVL